MVSFKEGREIQRLSFRINLMLVDPFFWNFWTRGWHWCNDNRHWCSGVLQWCSKFRCGDKWGDSWLWFSFWFGGFFQGSWIASLGSVVLGCAPAVLCLLGLATVLPGKKSSWWRKTQNKGAWVTKTKVERDANKATGDVVQEGSTTMISNRR